MAHTLIFPICILVAEFLGCTMLTWIFLAAAAIFLIAWRSAIGFSFLFASCALGMTSWISKDWFGLSMGLILLYLQNVSFGTNRCSVKLDAPVGLGLFWWLILITSSVFDNALLQIISGAGVVNCLPAIYIPVGKWFRLLVFAVCASCVTFSIMFQLKTVRTGKIAYLEHGKWATAGVEWNQGNLSMQSAYSYSEFNKLIGGVRISLSELNNDYHEAWMITPTNPFSESELTGLLGWISSGGKLILVTDHTDVFGHARVANQLLSRMGIEADYTAFFPEGDEWAKDAWGTKYTLRTSNTFSGRGFLPLLSARWFNESVDYSTKNFFGRLRATGEDEHAQRVISGVRGYGNGELVFMGDSTMFSNFATYAPSSQKLASLLSASHSTAHLYRLFPFTSISLFLLMSVAAGRKMRVFCSLANALIMFLLATPPVASELSWGGEDGFVWWSGDDACVEGSKDSSKSLSTAYTISSLAGKKPRWTDFPNSKESGIWVSTNNPPRGWRWLSPDALPQSYEKDESAFLPLYDQLDAKPIISWQASQNYNKLAAGKIWTNDVLGDEWFDRGVSPSRMERFRALWDWIKGNPISERASKCPIPSHSLTDWILKVPSRPDVKIEIPLDPGLDGEFLYLGRGISGRWTTTDGEKVLLGLKPYSENLAFPEVWALHRPVK